MKTVSEFVKRFVYSVLIICMTLQGSFSHVHAQSTQQPLYHDLDGSYALREIVQLTEAGIMNGYGDGSFRPNQAITRKELAAIIARSAGLAEAPAAAAKFKDVPASAWYRGYVGAIVNAGIAKGTSDSTFAPEATATREQVVILFMQAMGLKEAAEKWGGSSGFTDLARLSLSSQKLIAFAAHIGFISGMKAADGTMIFRPLASADRQAIAKLACDYYLNWDRYVKWKEEGNAAQESEVRASPAPTASMSVTPTPTLATPASPTSTPTPTSVTPTPTSSSIATSTPTASIPATPTPTASIPVTPTPTEPAPSSSSAPSAHELEQMKYSWRNVALGAGGYVTGLLIHPLQKDLVYIRTDVGGMYRYNPHDRSWVPLNEGFGATDWNYYGGESFALDPADPNVIYAAFGKYSSLNGSLFKSVNKGESWTKLDLDVKIGANEGFLKPGERLAVDPHDSNHILYGSLKEGLWESKDAGASWNKVTQFLLNENALFGINSLVFDPYHPGVIYVSVYNDGIYRSSDNGATWESIAGEAIPQSPVKGMQLAVSPDGSLFVTSSGPNGIFKFSNGVWSDVTPLHYKEKGYSAISIDLRNSDHIVAALDSNYGGGKSTDGIYLTTDGGANWKELRNKTMETIPWYEDYYFAESIASLQFDPHVPGKVWMSDWRAVWQADDIDAEPAVWTDPMRGVESMVAFALAAPPSGPLLVNGMADLDGSSIANPDTYPVDKLGPNSGMRDTYSIAYSEEHPEYMVRSVSFASQTDGTVSYSSDGGRTWRQGSYFQTLPKRVAMSATDPNRIIVTLPGGVQYTADGGQTWNAAQFTNSAGEPVSIPFSSSPWDWSQPIAADKKDGNCFYLLQDGKLFRSGDGGASFREVSSLTSGQGATGMGFELLKTAPGFAGEVWAGLRDNGLYRSEDSGSTFEKIDSVQSVYLFAFGKGKPDSERPALYLYGKVSGFEQEGIFRSLDDGETWESIGDLANRVGDEPNVMEGSMREYGLLFIGTNGRGIYCGRYEAVANASFENGLAAWDESGDAAVDESQAKDGYRSVRLNGNDAQIAQTVSGLKPNTAYMLSSWINGGVPVPGETIELGAMQADGTIISSIQIAGEGDFKRSELVFATDSTGGDITIYAKYKGTRSVTIDDIHVVEADMEPPSKPSGLIAKTKTDSMIQLSWTPSLDDSSVIYEIYRDSVLVGNTVVPRLKMEGLQPDTEYTFYVIARDLYHNKSAPSDPLIVRTKANKVANPGFEQGDLSSWNAWGAPIAQTSHARTGRYSAMLPAGQGMAQSISGLLPNRSYTLRAWIQTDSPDDYVQVGVKDYGGPEVNQTVNSPTYTQATVTFTTDSSGWAQIYVWRNAGSGTAYVDDFELVPNLVLNAGFEEGTLNHWDDWGGASITGDYVKSGTHAAKISGEYKGFAQSIGGLKPNTTYTLTGWVALDSSGGSVQIGVKDYGGPEINYTISSNGYARDQLTFTTGENYTWAVLYAWKNSGSGAAYLDDFELTEQP